MIDIELRVLATLIAVVECGSIAAAARRRGYSSGAVSRQMSWLQRRLGVRIFEPDGRSIRCTSTAVALATQAERVLAEFNEFEQIGRSASLTGRRRGDVPGGGGVFGGVVGVVDDGS
ncbi:helix-turn-helix domain-containing protein [Microbacterium aurantiacum]|uniref:LysR family transcriptional regulator n=1 Tax=Microbacterium aurantiacum TaxID=162393 RepID=A0ABT8FW08_9MICO|nr:LysR family transcriptional regulator [Microbacterium aurantiacum]MDN4465405.1 LysR family transcriptional regulator [Microbacterium aurantiacum]